LDKILREYVAYKTEGFLAGWLSKLITLDNLKVIGNGGVWVAEKGKSLYQYFRGKSNEIEDFLASEETEEAKEYEKIFNYYLEPIVTWAIRNSL